MRVCVCVQIGDLQHYYSFRHRSTVESKQDVTSTVAQEPKVKERDTLETGLFISGTSITQLHTHTRTPLLMLLNLQIPAPELRKPCLSLMVIAKQIQPLNR